MQPTTDTDYQKLFTELIKKQMLVLGPDITLAKARNVQGLTVNVDGVVQKIEGDPQAMLQSLINQFVELSGMIVKKTMESILTSYPGMAGLAAGSMAMAASGPALNPSVVPPISTTPSIPVEPVPTEFNHTADPSAPQVAPVVTPTVEVVPDSKPEEPPSMSSMNLTSLSPTSSDNAQKEPKPANFSTQEMADLNKALEELSKAPLSTEATSQPGVAQA